MTTPLRDHYDILGYRATVSTNIAEAHGALRCIFSNFAPLPNDHDAPGPHYALLAAAEAWQIVIDGAVFDTAPTLPSALAILEWHLLTTALDQRDDLFQLHAAALCLPTERAGLVLVGDSGSGKTTLTIGLMLRGFLPFSDDVALLDPTTLALRPFHRLFHVRAGTWEAVAPLAAGPLRRDPAPDGYFLPPQWAERPAPARWLIFPEYGVHHTPQLLPMTTAEIATALLAHTTTLRRTPPLALATVARLIEQTACYRCLVGDLRASVDLIQQFVADPHHQEQPHAVPVG